MLVGPAVGRVDVGRRIAAVLKTLDTGKTLLVVAGDFHGDGPNRLATVLYLFLL